MLTSQQRATLLRLLQALPAGVPYAGHAYSRYLDAKDQEALRALIQELGLHNEKNFDAVRGELGAQREMLRGLLDAAQGAPQKSSGTRIRIEQRAKIIQNINGDMTVIASGAPQHVRRNRKKR